MRVSKLGIVLVVLYLLVSTFCLINGLYSEDTKSKFVLMQLPIALQMAVIDAIGGGFLLERLSWFSGYLLIGGVTVFFIYLVGALFDGSLL